MNIYRLLKYATGSGMPRPLKMLGLAAMYRLRRRTAGVFLDPVLSCNLRCRMCYFSDPAKRASMHGVMDREQIEEAAKAIFPSALKLQIGCGAEPTLYPRLEEIVALGKKYGVPYISLTTNGQLIANGRCSLESLAAAGLDELTLSLHGTSAPVYENLMPGASFENLLKLTEIIAEVKQKHPGFRLRINYTVNSMNVHDLEDSKFWSLWKDGGFPDIIQLRPVQKIGESDWNDFNLKPLIENYDSTIGAVAAECKRRGIQCLYPDLHQIEETAGLQDGSAALIEELTYAYVSPDGCYKEDFDEKNETYINYHKRKHTPARLLKSAFSNPDRKKRNVSKKLNYKIK